MQEPWSSGHCRRILFKKPRVRIPAPDAKWLIFNSISGKNCIFCLKMNTKRPDMADSKKYQAPWLDCATIMESFYSKMNFNHFQRRRRRHCRRRLLRWFSQKKKFLRRAQPFLGLKYFSIFISLSLSLSSSFRITFFLSFIPHVSLYLLFSLSLSVFISLFTSLCLSYCFYFVLFSLCLLLCLFLSCSLALFLF